TFIPARKLQYSVTFPASVKVGYKVFNNEENQIKFAKTEEKGKTTYTWTATMADKYEYDDDGPSISYYVPHVALFVQEYTANGETVRVLDKVEDLYAWYQSLIGDLNQDKDPTINALVDSLTAGLTNDEEKVKRIYYWVQDNIKYVAFEDGMSGFIPRPAAKVCTKRYGDCKDMSSILTEMLEAAEIPSSLVWIGSRDIPYTYDDLPTPSVDNHMIAMVELNGKVIFLDATSQHTPIGMPSSFIQGKQALVSKTKENYDLLMVPVVEKETNYQRDSAFVKVDGNQLSGQGTAAFGGYVNVMVRERLNNRKTDKKKDYIERLLEKGHNKFRLAEYEAEGETNKDNDLVIDYQFEVPDYAQQVNNAIYVNLNLDKSYLNDFIEVEDRKVALEIDYKFQDEFTTVFEIPEGYSLDYLPESSSYEGDNFGFTIEYRRQGNQVQMSKTFYINTLLIDTDEFEAWNSMVKTLSSAYNESIVLKK
ncbi:MAG: transglutaminase family protein, partial [Salibacteraceae bacterium]